MKQIKFEGKLHSFPDDATDEEINTALGGTQSSPSIARSYGHYLLGLGGELGQAGANIGQHIADLPFQAYEAVTGKPSFHPPKANILSLLPESEATQTGRHVGETVEDIASFMIPAKLGIKGLSALSKLHPFTKGQLGRQIQGPINAAEKAGILHKLSPKDIYELDQLLSHPALESGGATGRSLTPLGRHALLQGASKGNLSSLFSSQSLLGDLERAIPKQGESILASTRVRPLKQRILEGMQQSIKEGGLPEEAEKLQQARQGARRYFKTKKVLGKITKPLSIAALIKAGISGTKVIP